MNETSSRMPDVKQLSLLYNSDEATLLSQEQRYRSTEQNFLQLYPQHKGAYSFFSSPGRSEIIGNHTDHQNGHGICCAVNLDTIACAAPNNENIIRLKSKGFVKTDVLNISNLDIHEDEIEHSAGLIRGIAARFKQLGLEVGGFDAYTDSMFQTGSGLSSSAAFELLVITIIDYFYNDNRLSGLERAKIGQYAENVYYGKPSGLLDQCGSGIGGFIYLDFKDPLNVAYRQLQIDQADLPFDLIISHPGGSHSDMFMDYASIPEEMFQVAKACGGSVLSDISKATFLECLPELGESQSARSLLRALHFFDEQERVDLAYKALHDKDYTAFYNNINASGLSSWMLLQNVVAAGAVREQPLALALAFSQEILGDEGACRVHGGGFAGTIQAFVPKHLSESYVREMDRVFGAGCASLISIRNLGATALDAIKGSS